MASSCLALPKEPEKPTSSGKSLRICRIISTYRLSHISGQYEDIQVLGEGSDSLDKAANKAMTVAYKYALRQAFLIETGDDDPDRHGSDATLADKPKQQKTTRPNGQQGVDVDPGGTRTQEYIDRLSSGLLSPNNALRWMVKDDLLSPMGREQIKAHIAKMAEGALPPQEEAYESPY